MQEGHVSLWHPWQDKPGQRHTPVLWNIERFGSSLDDVVWSVAQNQYYVFCNDILDEKEIPDSIALLRHKKTEAYISRTGKVVALRVKGKRKSGFFIPASVWGCNVPPNEGLIKNVNRIFTLFGFEAITPASLSEKVLRSTLPERVFISRPNHMLRNVILRYGKGGRIDGKQQPTYYHKLREYDENKSYLYHSQEVPSPFKAPHGLFYGENGYQDTRWLSYPTGFYHIILTCHWNRISPIQLPGDGGMHAPSDGETIDTWLWKEEIQDCIEAGYTLERVYEGYAWEELSTFMQPWSDILWDKYSSEDEQPIKDIIKTMMVGLPGRFLKSPEVFTLVHESEYKKGDEPVIAKWEPGGNVSTPWFIRAEMDMQSAQLTPIGDYIRMKCRQEIYHRMKAETERGNEVVSCYIDCYTVSEPTKTPEILGKERGQWKEKSYSEVWAIENQIIPKNIHKMRAPGFTGIERRMLHEKYHPP